jgi:hypothetical protein
MEETRGEQTIPWFGARRIARQLATELRDARSERDGARSQLKLKADELEATLQELRIKAAELDEVRAQRDEAHKELESLGMLSPQQLEAKRAELEREINAKKVQLSETAAVLASANAKLKEVRREIVVTEDTALLQEVGVYEYRHPLTDVVAYQSRLRQIEDQKRVMAKQAGGAVLADTNWTVNGSLAQGRVLVQQYSKLMLRAFNAEADTLARWLKPYKLDSALDRLKKASDIIERLGKTMKIRISEPYYRLRIQELELTADFLHKQAEQREAERMERERSREEQKAQMELEAERARLEKERQHYTNALQILLAQNDEAGVVRLRDQLSEVDEKIKTVDYRAANTRAGYVYLISNIGSFGERIVKIGLTRRLNPMDRIHELGGASVPFNFDVHALFFSNDAVGIEAALRERLEKHRVNLINRRREFFGVTPVEVKEHLSELAGQLLEFREVPEALEYRRSKRLQAKLEAAPVAATA